MDLSGPRSPPCRPRLSGCGVKAETCWRPTRGSSLGRSSPERPASRGARSRNEKIGGKSAEQFIAAGEARGDKRNLGGANVPRGALILKEATFGERKMKKVHARSVWSGVEAEPDCARACGRSVDGGGLGEGREAHCGCDGAARRVLGSAGGIVVPFSVCVAFLPLPFSGVGAARRAVGNVVQ